MNITPAQKSIYNEDITPVGESILGQPCVVWSMTVSIDVPGTAIVKFYDNLSQDNTKVVEKVVLSSSTPTVTLSYPKGKNYLTGIFATCNASSVNVSVDYD